jgi:DNA repair exonuclease SbcCD ATPase subunit
VSPDEVHPSHDVREEGILISDPVCQKCRASVYGSADRLRVECSGTPTIKENLTVEPLSKTQELPETVNHWKALAKYNGNTLVQKAMEITALEARATAAEAERSRLIDRIDERDAEIRSLRAQVAKERADARAVLSDLNAHKDALAQTAEFICRKCGKRQDGPTDNEARF